MEEKTEKKSFSWPKSENTAFRTPHNAWGSRCPLIPKTKTEQKPKETKEDKEK